MSTEKYERMIRSMPEGLEAVVLAVLAEAQGRAKALGRDVVLSLVQGEGLDVNERQVRRAIHGLRRKGELICSAPGNDGGYYMAGSLTEFDEFCQRELHPKAIDMLETESAMKAAAIRRFGDAVQPALLG